MKNWWPCVLLLLAASSCLHVANAHAVCSASGIPYTKTMIDGTVQANDIAYLKGPVSGAPNELIFIRTSNRTVWFSNYFGSNWTNVQSQLTDVDLFDSSLLSPHNQGGIVSIHTNSNKTRVFVVGTAGRFWYSDNGTAWTSRQVMNPFGRETMYIEWFEPNPFVPNNIAVIASTRCTWTAAVTCNSTRTDILVSNDGGDSFRRVDSFVAFRFPFRASVRTIMSLERGSDDTIFLDRNQIWYSAFRIREPYGGDSGDQRPSWVTLLTRPASLLTITDAPAIYVATGILSDEPSSGLPVWDNVREASYNGAILSLTEQVNAFDKGSTDFIDIWSSSDKAKTFQHLQLPPPPELPIVPGGFFATGSSREDKVSYAFIAAVDFLYNGMDFTGDLWIADAQNPGKYVWSLSRHVQLYDVASAESVLLANHFVGRRGFNAETLITFNKGGSWQNIKPPRGHNYDCNAADCFLHLSLDPGSIHSEHSVPGFIVANGNVGRYYDINQQSVFVSRDGGATWTQITDEFGSTEPESLFDISVDGSMFVSVPFRLNTSVLAFSLSGGLDWEHCEFDYATINSIYSVSSTDEKGVIMFASANNEFSVQHFNFDSRFQTPCTDADYETWSTVLDGVGCLVGRNTTYRRLKAGVVCSNPTLAGTVVSSEPCQCTNNDFVCSQCFYWNATSRECAFSPVCEEATALTPPPADCFAPQTFVANYTGYKKLAGSACTGGADLTVGPRTLNCPIQIVRPPPPVVAPVALAEQRVTPNDVAAITVGVVIAILLLLFIIFLAIIIRRKIRERRPSAPVPEPDDEVNL